MSGAGYFIIAVLCSIYLFAIKRSHDDHGFGYSLFVMIMSILNMGVMLLGDPVVWLGFTMLRTARIIYFPAQPEIISMHKYDSGVRMLQNLLIVVYSAAIFFVFQYFR